MPEAMNSPSLLCSRDSGKPPETRRQPRADGGPSWTLKAIQFDNSIPRYLLSKAVGRWHRPAFWGPLSCLRYREVDIPRLPGDDWVRVKVRYGGICGSDISMITLRDSPSVIPFASFPFTLGHENVGTVDEAGRAVTGVEPGQRVVVDPVLSCEPRGFDDVCPACRRGDFSLCRNFTAGRLAPGFIIGTCRDTGGSWSPYFLAHRSQLVPVPDGVSDESAVLVEPFACSLHPVLRHPPADDDTVVIIGCGVIGLTVVAALRATGSRCRIVAVARYDFQAEAARSLGADIVVQERGTALYERMAELLDAKIHRPPVGKPVLEGGARVVFECAGHDDALDDALRLAGHGARVVVLGLAAIPRNVDWTPVWMKELHVAGSFLSGGELREGKPVRTAHIAMELLAEGKVDLTSLVTHRFRLDDYAAALSTVMARGRERVIKAVFEFP